MKSTALVAFLIFLKLGVFSQPNQGTFDTKENKPGVIFYPDKNWAYHENKEEYGWNTDKLNKLTDFVRDSTHATGLVIIQSGKILVDYGDIEELSYIASCRKRNDQFE